MDLNSDGVITRDEFDAAFTQDANFPNFQNRSSQALAPLFLQPIDAFEPPAAPEQRAAPSGTLVQTLCDEEEAFVSYLVAEEQRAIEAFERHTAEAEAYSEQQNNMRQHQALEEHKEAAARQQLLDSVAVRQQAIQAQALTEEKAHREASQRRAMQVAQEAYAEEVAFFEAEAEAYADGLAAERQADEAAQWQAIEAQAYADDAAALAQSQANKHVQPELGSEALLNQTADFAANMRAKYRDRHLDNQTNETTAADQQTADSQSVASQPTAASQRPQTNFSGSASIVPSSAALDEITAKLAWLDETRPQPRQLDESSHPPQAVGEMPSFVPPAAHPKLPSSRLERIEMAPSTPPSNQLTDQPQRQRQVNPNDSQGWFRGPRETARQVFAASAEASARAAALGIAETPPESDNDDPIARPAAPCNLVLTAPLVAGALREKPDAAGRIAQLEVALAKAKQAELAQQAELVSLRQAASTPAGAVYRDDQAAAAGRDASSSGAPMAESNGSDPDYKYSSLRLDRPLLYHQYQEARRKLEFRQALHQFDNGEEVDLLTIFQPSPERV